MNSTFALLNIMNTIVLMNMLNNSSISRDHNILNDLIAGMVIGTVIFIVFFILLIIFFRFVSLLRLINNKYKKYIEYQRKKPIKESEAVRLKRKNLAREMANEILYRRVG